MQCHIDKPDFPDDGRGSDSEYCGFGGAAFREPLVKNGAFVIKSGVRGILGCEQKACCPRDLVTHTKAAVKNSRKNMLKTLQCQQSE